MKRLFTIAIAIFVLSYASCYGQSRTIFGRVLNSQTKAPLLGVYVQLKGLGQGAVSEADGKFAFKTTQTDGTLVFSLLGSQTQEVLLTKDQNQYNLELVEETKMLENVVVGFKRINVHSRRRQEDLQKIPESVTAFSADQIEKLGISTPADFIALTPNVSFINAQNLGNVAITARGISQVRNGEAPVAYVVDGVIMPSPNSINQELYDIELIEVMKGPQGALYGRNAIAGAINIVTKKPTNKFENLVKLHYGNGANFKANALSSGSIIKNKLFYRVGGFFQDRKGLIENQTNNKKVDFINQSGFRAQIMALPTYNLSIDAGISYNKGGAGAIYYAPLPATDQNPAGNYSIKPSSDFLGRSDRSLADAYLKMRYDFNQAGNLEYITAYSKVDEVFVGDLDFTSASLLRQKQALINNGFTQELRLSSKTNQRFRYIVGGFLMNNKRRLITTGTVDLAGAFAPFFGFPVDPALASGTKFAPFLERDEDNINTTLAGFGQINYDILPNLELSLAARYDLDKRKQTNLKENKTQSKDFSQFQPKISLAYRPTENSMIYANYAQGFRSGGFNAPGITAFKADFDKETTNNFEFGLKTSWFAERLIFNASAFNINFTNQQIFIVDITTVSQGIININKTRSRGVEFEIKAKPERNLELFAGFGLTDARVTQDDSISWVGKYSPLTPRTTLSVAAQYNIKLSEKCSIAPRIDLENRGDLYWHIDNKDMQKSFSLLNARINVFYARTTLALYANNITNTKYNTEFFAKEFSGSTSDIRWQAQPLTWGISVQHKF